MWAGARCRGCPVQQRLAHMYRCRRFRLFAAATTAAAVAARATGWLLAATVAAEPASARAALGCSIVRAGSDANGCGNSCRRRMRRVRFEHGRGFWLRRCLPSVRKRLAGLPRRLRGGL